MRKQKLSAAVFAVLTALSCCGCGGSVPSDAPAEIPACACYVALTFDDGPRQGTTCRLLDGLNESNHRGSFVHSELHEENKERRASGLSKGTKRSSRKTAQPALRQRQKQAGSQSIGAVIKWVIFAIIGLNILSSVLSGLF